MKKWFEIHGKGIAQIEANVPKEYLAVTSRLSRGYLAVQDVCLLTFWRQKVILRRKEGERNAFPLPSYG